VKKVDVIKLFSSDISALLSTFNFQLSTSNLFLHPYSELSDKNMTEQDTTSLVDTQRANLEEEEIFERGLGEMPSLRDLTVRTLPQVPPRGVSLLAFKSSCYSL
jgi:hypothetical protein